MEPEKAKNFNSRTKGTRDDWQTPEYVVKALGDFDLDPCANISNPTRLAKKGFTILDDGLKQAWQGRVWLNPPYGNQAKVWLDRLAAHKNGIALIPPRVGAQWFHNKVFTAADAILFIKGRISFLDLEMQPADGNNADSILIAYGVNNVQSLRDCGIEGILWINPKGAA